MVNLPVTSSTPSALASAVVNSGFSAVASTVAFRSAPRSDSTGSTAAARFASVTVTPLTPGLIFG